MTCELAGRRRNFPDPGLASRRPLGREGDHVRVAALECAQQFVEQIPDSGVVHADQGPRGPREGCKPKLVHRIVRQSSGGIGSTRIRGFSGGVDRAGKGSHRDDLPRFILFRRFFRRLITRRSKVQILPAQLDFPNRLAVLAAVRRKERLKAPVAR